MSALGAQAVGWQDGDGFASHVRRQQMIAAAAALTISVACAVVLVASDEKVLLLAVLGSALVGVVVLMRPVIGVYALFAGALLFEQTGITGLTPITEQVHFFKGIDTFTALPLHASPADLLLVLSAVSLVAAHVTGRVPFRMGTFGWAVAGYGAAFVVGIAIGIARGAAWSADAAITELRSPLQMCVMYFLAASLIRERKQLTVLLWMFALLVGVKALQGILNYQESLPKDLSVSYSTTLQAAGPPQTSVEVGAAVHIEDLASDVGGLFGGQKKRRAGNVLGRPQAA